MATDLTSVRSLRLTSLGYIPHNLSLVFPRLHLLNLELAIIIAVFLFYVELYHLLYHTFLYHLAVLHLLLGDILSSGNSIRFHPT